MNQLRNSLFTTGASAIVIALGALACTGEQGPAGPSPSVEVSSVAPGAECPSGGVRVTIGDDEPFVVCNGETGSAGERGPEGEDGVTPTVEVSPIDPEDESSPCGEEGGVIVTVTVGDDVTTSYVCDGSPGDTGESPEITVSTVEPDEEGACGLAGGTQVSVTVGADEDVIVVCNGADGRDGVSGLRVNPLDPGSDCEHGGIEVEVLDGDGVVESTYTICNGAPGEAGPPPTVTITDADPADCPDGGRRITIGSAAPFDICDGAAGEPTPVRVETLSPGEEGCDEGGYVLIVGEGAEEMRYPICVPIEIPLTVDWCRLVSPTDPVTREAGESLEAFGQLFIDGVTGEQSAERPSSLRAELGLGPRDDDPTADPSAWTFVTAMPNSGFDQGSAPNNDEFVGTLADLEVGAYDFAFRFSTDDGANWVYCDTTGLDTGYAPSDAGKLTVEPGPVVLAGWVYTSEDTGAWDNDALFTTEGVSANDTARLRLTGANPTDFVGISTLRALNSNNWHTPSTDREWRIEISTEGHESIEVSSYQRSSGTGPRDFRLEASLDGTDWAPIEDITLANDDTTGVVTGAALPAAFADQASVLIRWVLISEVRVDGAMIASGGTSRIGNVRVHGRPL